MSKQRITAEKLKELLDYSPETGIFTRKVKTAVSVQIGDVTGSPDARGYLQISIGNYPHKAHQLAWLWAHGEWPKGVIDHINGIHHDNRLCNLRDVTVSQNVMNSALSKANKTGHKGVWYDPKRDKYQAYITAGGKRIGLGRFHTLEEAAKCRAEAAKAHHGEFARAA